VPKHNGDFGEQGLRPGGNDGFRVCCFHAALHKNVAVQAAQQPSESNQQGGESM
jgi:hypothetical protein